MHWNEVQDNEVIAVWQWNEPKFTMLDTANLVQRTVDEMGECLLATGSHLEVCDCDG